MSFVENYEITLSDNGRALWTFELSDALDFRQERSAAVAAWLSSDSQGQFVFDPTLGRLSARFPDCQVDGQPLSLDFGPLPARANELAHSAQSFLLCPAREGLFLGAFEIPALTDIPSPARSAAVLPARKFSAGGSR